MIEIREVRPAVNPKELNALLQMHLECFRPCELHPEQFHRGYWWMALDAGEPVGFGGIAPSVRWGDVGYLCRSGVVPSARGNGLQKRLIAARLAKARRAGWNWAITDTHKNPASANSLITAGFRMYQPTRPWAFKDSCYWRRQTSLPRV